MASQKPYLDVQNLTKTFGADILFENISFSVAEGQKVGLIAKNGTGKSTLLSILTGKEDYDSGEIVYANGIKVGYLEQTPHYDPEESVLDACFNHQGQEEKILKAKQILTQLRINDLTQPMGQLSGGQQKRVALANILINEPDMLILDEPTNHLDIQSKEVLKEAILAFDGTAIIVSHDREFLDGLVSKVYEFGGGKVKEHLGGIYDYLRSRNMESLNDLNAATVFAKTNADDNKKKGDSAETSTDGSQPAKLSYAEHKEQQKKIRKAEKLVEESEKKISAMEDRLKELDAILCTPEGASDMTVVNEYTAIKQRMDEEEERWTLLSEELEELKAN